MLHLYFQKNFVSFYNYEEKQKEILFKMKANISNSYVSSIDCVYASFWKSPIKF